MNDSLKLQCNSDSFVAFFDKLGLSLNLYKRKVMPFNRIRSPMLFYYHLRRLNISRCVRFVMDLGFKLSNYLDPGLLNEKVFCKALSVFDIITRLAKDFKLTSTFKVLYCSLVRQIMNYGAIIWDFHTA